MSTPADLHLPNLFTAPPGEWRYEVPETGQKFGPQPSLNGLIEQLQQHYRANGYGVPDYDTLAQRIEQYVCERIPAYCGDPKAIAKEESDKGQPIDLRMTFHSILSGTRIIGKWLLGGRKMVEQEQADARAETCIGCSYHRDPLGCSSCNLNVLHQAVETIVGKRRTKVHDQLRACAVCFCSLRAKCWFPIEAIVNEMPEGDLARLPNHCWIVTEQQPKEAA